MTNEIIIKKVKELRDIKEKQQQKNNSKQLNFSFLTMDSLKEFMQTTDKRTLGQTIIDFMNDRGLTPPEIYKKILMDHTVFHKYTSDKRSNPDKKSIFKIIIGLELNIDEANLLLKKAGLAFSNSDFDNIIEAFIIEQEYNIHKIDEFLFESDIPPLFSLK